MKTIKIMGIDLPRFEDCKRCGTKEVCEFYQFAYMQPCSKCRESKEYQEEEAKKDKELRSGGIHNAFENQRVSGVFEGKGTRFFTNLKGNIVKTEPINTPVKTGG